MEYEKNHVVWIEQVQKLVDSIHQLKETDSINILSHFFSQVINRDYHCESNTLRTTVNKLVQCAIKMSSILVGTVRQRAVHVLKLSYPLDEPILKHVRLNDIRNTIVFEIYKRCSITIDTYFERFSSPPGNQQQSQDYLDIAHGRAVCTADWTKKLSFTANMIQILKLVFTVCDILNNKEVDITPLNLNWSGDMWIGRVQKSGLGNLVWDIFLDIWDYEHCNLNL